MRPFGELAAHVAVFEKLTKVIVDWTPAHREELNRIHVAMTQEIEQHDGTSFEEILNWLSEQYPKKDLQ